jgi:hypothetical protein
MNTLQSWTSRWFLGLLLVLIGSPDGFCQDRTADAGNGSIAGVVLDADGSPVAGASVIVCDSESGIPVVAGSYLPLTHDRRQIEDNIDNMAHATTTESGEFSLAGLPVGEYRLIAQSWQRDEPVESMLDINGEVVFLHGLAEHVSVKADETTTVRITPAGDLTLHVRVKSANSDTLLLVSRSPTRADPILGFTGWVGPFMTDMLAGNRMPLGKTTIHGLPAGMVHVVVFANDDIPGWGAAAVELKDKTTTTVTIPFISGWSDAVHSPPPALEELGERLKQLDLDQSAAIMQLLAENNIEIDRMHPVVAMAKNLDKQIKLADNSEHRLGDILAAQAYASMKRWLESKNSSQNPYVAPAVKRIPSG